MPSVKLLRAYRLHEEKPSLEKNVILDDLGEKSVTENNFLSKMSAGFKTVHPYIYIYFL